MTERTPVHGLQVATTLYRFIEDQVLPSTGVKSEKFWKGFDTVVSDLAPKNIALLPEPENDTIDAFHVPLPKLAPVIVRFWLVAPWPSEDGLIELTLGAAVTENALGRSICVKLLVPLTDTVRRDIDAPDEMLMLAVTLEVLTQLVPFTVIPVPLKATL